ncbi:hypothetical protein Bca4012_076750 [Brassica carinata]
MEDRYTNRSGAEEPPDQNTRRNSTGFAGDLKGKVDSQTNPYPKADPNLLCRYTYLAVSPEPQDGRRFQPRILRRQSSKLPGAQTYQRETEEERMGKERQEDREEGALQRWRENTDPPETNLRFNF